MLTLVIVLTAIAALLLWGLFGRRSCQSCGTRIEHGEAPYDRIPTCWRCW